MSAVLFVRGWNVGTGGVTKTFSWILVPLRWVLEKIDIKRELGSVGACGGCSSRRSQMFQKINVDRSPEQRTPDRKHGKTIKTDRLFEGIPSQKRKDSKSQPLLNPELRQ